MSLSETKFVGDRHFNTNSAPTVTIRSANNLIEYGPSTSRLKTRGSLRFSIEPEHSDEETPLPSPLHSLDDLSRRLLQRNFELEGTDSYLSLDLCTKEIATNTDNVTIISRRASTPNAPVGRDDTYGSSPPPPYSFDDRGTQSQGYGRSTAVYQEIYRSQTPTYSGQAPAYRPVDLISLPSIGIFDERRIRNDFIKKVYIILSIQLLISFGFVSMCVWVEEVRYFVAHNLIILIVAAVLVLILEIILFCFESVRRTFPANFILLFLFTFAFAYIMGGVSCHAKQEAVLLAVGITAGMCLLITLIAWINCCDITRWGAILGIISLVVLVFGLIAMIVTLVTGSNILYIIYAGIATVLVMFYLLYDTQMIMGGGRVMLSTEEYILGALTLYVDIVTMFMYILYLLTARRN